MGAIFRKGVNALKKKIGKLFVFLMAACLISITACRKEKPADDDTITVIPTMGAAEVTPAVTFMPSSMKNIIYYTLSDSMEKEEMTAVLPEDTELTPEYLVNYVTETMDAVSVAVEVDSVTTSGQSVIVSFSEDTAPVCGTDAELEGEILDAIAQSILENFTEYTSVIYRVMGQAYVSENRSFSLNHVYLGN